MNSVPAKPSSKLPARARRGAAGPKATRPLVWRAKVQYRAGIRPRRAPSQSHAQD